MIRIHLGSAGLGSVSVGASPDYDAELTAAGRAYARSSGQPRDPLVQLYTRSISPDLAGGVSRLYLSHLFARRSPTPFTKALAEGEERARSVLANAVAHLRSTAIEPYRSGIRSAVAARAVGLSQIYVGSGTSAMLQQLGQGISFRHGVLELATAFDADLELGRRTLQIQAVALSRRVTLAEPASDQLTVRIPAGPAPRIGPGQRAALRPLLGTSRAQALESIVMSGGITGRQLASLLGVSNATASRHAAVLRRAGLIQTLRMGQSVEHVATALGYHLAQTETPTRP
ncbi:ArsR family transcriptional regulator [Streptomyces filipinensis]|uniref:ArsR family transcriptional regulator n=1 Tax=Streptomyces filipinensis TaxID=66887 RepID=A0A918IAR0_9ACTN|nr:ArsR family transcriptional regulator [Streptomyces filipinensis]